MTDKQRTPSPINASQPATPHLASNLRLPLGLAEHNSKRSERFAEPWLGENISSPSLVILSAARRRTRGIMDQTNIPTGGTTDVDRPSTEGVDMIPLVTDESVIKWESLHDENDMLESPAGPTSFFRDMYEMTMRSRMFPDY